MRGIPADIRPRYLLARWLIGCCLRRRRLLSWARSGSLPRNEDDEGQGKTDYCNRQVQKLRSLFHFCCPPSTEWFGTAKPPDPDTSAPRSIKLRPFSSRKDILA